MCCLLLSIFGIIILFSVGMMIQQNYFDWEPISNPHATSQACYVAGAIYFGVLVLSLLCYYGRSALDKRKDAGGAYAQV
eukprot:tig00020603_g11755.t1